jgi:putative heme-binding domain-containing protein
MRMTSGTLLAAAGVLFAALVLTSDTPRAQQHSYTPQEIEEGRKLYDANCGRCHGETGAGIAGIELFRQIRRANSDDDIAKLIQTGIPGSTMPAHSFSTPQALSVVAYMRSMVGVTPGASPAATGGTGRGANAAAGGVPARGKEIFAGKGGCVTCHMAEGVGGTSGPNLSAAGVGRGGRGGPPQPTDPAVLERSILDPNADIAVNYRTFQVTPATGAPVKGRLLNQDTFSVQMLDEANNLRAFIKADVKETGFLPSPMPSYRGRLTPQELADVISYLLTLKG